MIKHDTALIALSDALLSLLHADTTPPCAGDPRFTSNDPDERNAAAPHCDRCPIKTTCHDTAQVLHPTHGIWAGHDWTKTNERRET